MSFRRKQNGMNGAIVSMVLDKPVILQKTCGQCRWLARSVNARQWGNQSKIAAFIFDLKK